MSEIPHITYLQVPKFKSMKSKGDKHSHTHTHTHTSSFA